MRIEAPMLRADGPRADVSEVLAQMRALKQAAQARPSADVAAAGAALPTQLVRGISPDGVAGVGAPASPLQTFGAHLESAMRNVTSLQADSSRLTEGLARGQHNDLVATMVASQKSSVAFQAATQVRNRLVTAYESIMNMPI